MISMSLSPNSLLFRSPANDASGLSLSHPYAQISESGTVAELNVLLFIVVCVRYGHSMRNHLNLFLDFNDNFPHSSSQITTYAD